MEFVDEPPTEKFPPMRPSRVGGTAGTSGAGSDRWQPVRRPRPPVSEERLKQLPPLEAESMEELLDLVGAIKAWSGKTAGQIAQQMKIPRSSAYRITAPQNRCLPKNKSRLGLYLVGCGLPDDLVMQVVDLYVKVTEEEAVKAATARLEASRAAAAAKDDEPAADVVNAEIVDETPVPKSELVTTGRPEQTVTLRQITDPPSTTSGSVPTVFGGSGGTVVHGDVRISSSTHGASADDGDRGESRGRRGGFLYVLENQAVFRNLLAFLLVLALIVIAVATVLLPDKVSASGAGAAMLLLALLAAAVLGVPLYGRHQRQKAQESRLKDE